MVITSYFATARPSLLTRLNTRDMSCLQGLLGKSRNVKKFWSDELVMEQGPGVLLEGEDLTESLSYSVKKGSVWPPYSSLSMFLHAPIPVLVHCIHTVT